MCIYVRKYLNTKEVNSFQGINKEKDFEMNVVELLDYKVFLCVSINHLTVTSIYF